MGLDILDFSVTTDDFVYNINISIDIIFLKYKKTVERGRFRVTQVDSERIIWYAHIESFIR